MAVTGATGFLGAHVVDLLLQAGALPIALVRDRVPGTEVSLRWREKAIQVAGDVEDQMLLERLLGEYDVKTVLHLAAQTQVEVANRNPASTYRTNVGGTLALLEACRRSPLVEQVVVASSDKAYGDQAILPYSEEMALDAVHPYDTSKACADLITRSYARSLGVPAVTTRCGNFYGPGDTNWRRLIPGTIRSVLEGERPVIRSDGRLTRDYLYVVDGALSYICLAEALAANPSLAGEAFNFSTERPMTVLEVVDHVQKAAGTALDPDIRASTSNEIIHQSLSAEKARRILGWTPSYSIDEALAETVRWYRFELANSSL
ncbi:MAG: GDP-mannose 4,6-dehydratase [Acidimicrobiales bacterium]